MGRTSKTVDTIARWRFDLDHADPPRVYLLTMYDTGKRDGRGQTYIRYRLTEKVGTMSTVLFSGEDFSGSPLHADDSIDTAMALMGFLTLRPGDTDAEYFKNYTPTQLRFTEQWAEELGYISQQRECYERW